MKKELYETQLAEREAAHMLLKNYVEKNSNIIATSLENLIPFFQDCSLHGLQSAINTVNVTFASVALKVIETGVNFERGEIEDTDRQYLPVDAGQMQSAIYYLSRFIELFAPLSAICESQDPAIKMCKNAFNRLERC